MLECRNSSASDLVRIGGYGSRIWQSRAFAGTAWAWSIYSGDLIVAVIDGQDSFASHANLGFRLIVDGKPELSDLAPPIFDFSMADPEGWIPGRLALHAGNREILGVDPHFSPVEILARALRTHGKNVEIPAWGVFGPDQREVVICRADFQLFPILLLLCFLLTAEQLQQHMVDQQL